jgi:hypothetical protein
MADLPEYLTLRHNRDQVGRVEVKVRRVVIGLLSLLLLAGLLNLFGQRPATSQAGTAAASLKVYAADRVRGGVIYEARFTITARQDVKEATLVLDSGWVEGITVNTIEPSPVGEASRDGKLVLTLGHVPRGTSHILFMHLQVNPTNLGHRSQDVALYDGDTFLTSVDRAVTVYP